MSESAAPADTPACDLLLTNAFVLTMDESWAIHRSGGVAITGERIVAVGPDARAYRARQTVDCGGRVLMPGLINAHTHAPMTLLRGLADDLRLDVWLMGTSCRSSAPSSAATSSLSAPASRARR